MDTDPELTKWHRKGMAVLLVLYLLVQVGLYLTATPFQQITLPDNLPQSGPQSLLVGIGPDEKEHFLYIRSLAEQGRLPAPLPRFRTDPEQYVSYEMQHPPLFYLLSAIVYKASAFLGLTGQWYALRFWCALLGAVTVFLAGEAARIAFPRRPLVTIGVPAMVAFMPINAHMNGVVSNEPLGLLLGTAAWLQAVRIARSSSPPTVKAAILLGVTLGVGALARITVLLWLPACLILQFAACRQHRMKPLPLLSGFLIPFFALAALWFGYLTVKLGTPLFRVHDLPLLGNTTLASYLSNSEHPLTISGLSRPISLPLRYIIIYVASTSWAPFWLIQQYVPFTALWQGLLVLPPFVTLLLLFFHSSNEKKKPEAERDNDPVGATILWAAGASVVFCVAAVLYQIFYVDWSIMNYAGRYILSCLPASSLLLLFALSTIGNRQAAARKPGLVAAVIFAALLLAFDIYSALKVRQFYRDKPTQDAVQPAVK